MDEAVAQLQAFLTKRPIDRAIYISIAQIYLQAKRFDAAEQAIQKALDLSPNPEDQEYALFVQGSIFERQKKYDQAEQTFKKVLSVDPLNCFRVELPWLHAGGPRRPFGRVGQVYSEGAGTRAEQRSIPRQPGLGIL